MVTMTFASFLSIFELLLVCSIRAQLLSIFFVFLVFFAFLWPKTLKFSDLLSASKSSNYLGDIFYGGKLLNCNITMNNSYPSVVQKGREYISLTVIKI